MKANENVSLVVFLSTASSLVLTCSCEPYLLLTHSTLMIMNMKFDKIVVDDDLMMLLATADDDHANPQKISQPSSPRRSGTKAYRPHCVQVKCQVLFI